MIKFYDNQGQSLDRYAMTVKNGENYDLYTFGVTLLPTDEVLGEFNTEYVHAEEKHLGNEVEWSQLPLAIQLRCLAQLAPHN